MLEATSAPENNGMPHNSHVLYYCTRTCIVHFCLSLRLNIVALSAVVVVGVHIAASESVQKNFTTGAFEIVRKNVVTGIRETRDAIIFDRC